MLQAKRAQFLFAFFLTLTFWVMSCSSGNDKSPVSPDTGTHPAGWLPVAHSQAAASDLTSCKSCHGNDLAGGIAGVSCTSCHLGSPTSVHPTDWAPVYAAHGPYVDAKGTTACSNQYCHGTGLTGVAGSGPSCTACHLGSPTSVHPTDWAPVYTAHGPYVDAKGTTACSNQYCHGTGLTGVAGSGPSCTLCHLGGPTSVHPSDWDPIYTTHGPYVDANTTARCANQYCHGLNLTGVPSSGPSCTSCHIGGITSGHPSNWVPIYSTHGPYVDANGTSSCANESCHGQQLTGVAGSGPSCTACHLGSPTSIHPTNWVPAYATHGPYVDSNGTTACSNQYCHGPQLTGVTASGPSCTSCHMGGPTSIHPAAWQGDACTNHGPYAYTNGTAGCSNIYCHGADLGGVSQSGPSCTKCHSPIPNSGQCNYCHGIPPNGTTYPNITGSHAVHMQLGGVQCQTCHNRPCEQHGDGTVEVVFDPVYSAETGTATFTKASGAVCSNVSCHGGPRSQRIRTTSTNTTTFYTQVTSQTTWTSDPSVTPDWYTGSISLNDTTQCFSCHTYGNTLYNGYYSGHHYFHVIEQGITCISCHDTLKLTNYAFHFPDLSTHVISSVTASASVISYINFNGTTCTSQICHSDTRSW